MLSLLCVCILTEASIDYRNYIHTKSNHLFNTDKNIRTHKPTLKLFDEISSELDHRWRRQIEFNIDADHEEGVGTDLVASANVNLYKTGSTRLDATARYSKHYSDYGPNGKTRYGGSLHFIQNY